MSKRRIVNKLLAGLLSVSLIFQGAEISALAGEVNKEQESEIILNESEVYSEEAEGSEDEECIPVESEAESSAEMVETQSTEQSTEETTETSSTESESVSQSETEDSTQTAGGSEAQRETDTLETETNATETEEEETEETETVSIEIGEDVNTSASVASVILADGTQQEYTSFWAAKTIAENSDGSTLKLLNDYDSGDKQIVFATGNFILDLNGHFLKCSDDILFEGTTNIEIIDSTGNNGRLGHCEVNSDNAKIKVTSGHFDFFTCWDGKEIVDVYGGIFDYFYTGSHVNTYIHGGKFKSISYGDNTVISGGIFFAMSPSYGTKSKISNLLADGYAYYSSANGMKIANTTVTEIKDVEVASYAERGEGETGKENLWYGIEYSIENGKLTLEGKYNGQGSFKQAPWSEDSGITSVYVNFSKESTATDFSYLFYCLTGAKTITFGDAFSTSGVIDMHEMFYTCKSIVELDLRSFDTSSVTNMSEMFRGCNSLKKLDISTFDTSKVTNMWYMFGYCESLEELNVSNFNTSNVTDMSSMFEACRSLKKLDVSNFNTSKVTDMSYMFAMGIKSLETDLEELNICNLDTSNVKNMHGMFNALVKLKKLDVSNFDTRKVENMGYMFSYCESLNELDVSNFDTSQVKDMESMFEDCKGLKAIDVSGFDTTKVVRMAYMFSGCSSLLDINLDKFDTSSVTYVSFMFWGCSKLTDINLSHFNMDNVKSFDGIFRDCTSLKTLNLGNWNLNNAKPFYGRELFFENCNSLVTINCPMNLKYDLPLPNNTSTPWTDESGNTYTNLPKEQTKSILITRGADTSNLVKMITLTPSMFPLKPGESGTVTADVAPASAANKELTWSSSDESIANVTQQGAITAKAEGTAQIRATALDGSGVYGACLVVVKTESEVEAPTLTTPKANRPSGSKIKLGTKIVLVSEDDGADIYYTTDGTEPTTESIRYTAPIEVKQDVIIKAFAHLEGYKDSEVVTFSYSVYEDPEEPESEPESSETEESSKTEESSESPESESEPDLSDGIYIKKISDQTYSGTAIKPILKVYYNKKLLQEKTDYTVTYKNNINAGKATVTIKGKGNLTGSVTESFTIEPKDINDTDVIIEDKAFVYDGKSHKTAPVVEYKGKKLKLGKDFTVTYSEADYTEKGTYTVSVKGCGNYTGINNDAKITITDKGKNIRTAKVSKIPTQEYNSGNAIVLSDNLLTVTLNKVTLTAGRDYDVSYTNNINPGKATVVIKGKGEYAGTKKATFTIRRTPAQLTDSMVINKNVIGSVQIVKGGCRPEPVLKSGDYTLIKNTDYTVSYKNNKNVGNRASVVVKGKGNYKGSITIPFTITEKSIAGSDISIRVPDVPYMGKANKYKSTPVITDTDGNALKVGKDYTIDSYSIDGVALDKKSNPENGSVITVTISGKGNYTGTIPLQYRINGTSIAKARIKLSNKAYTGRSVEIGQADIVSATIRIGKEDKPLTLEKDFEIVAYSNNIKKGNATVIIKGIGAYAGEKKVTFKITAGTITKK